MSKPTVPVNGHLLKSLMEECSLTIEGLAEEASAKVEIEIQSQPKEKTLSLHENRKLKSRLRRQWGVSKNTIQAGRNGKRISSTKRDAIVQILLLVARRLDARSEKIFKG